MGTDLTVLRAMAGWPALHPGQRAACKAAIEEIEAARKAHGNETTEQQPQTKDVGDLLMAITSLRQKAEDAEVLAKHVWDTATAQKACEHQWKIDGAHSNEYCGKCFVSKKSEACAHEWETIDEGGGGSEFQPPDPPTRVCCLCGQRQ